MGRMGWMAAGTAAALALTACQKKAETAQAPAAKPAPPAAKPPNRKPGLWEQRVQLGQVAQLSQVCIDAASDRKLGWAGQQPSDTPCEAAKVTPTPGGWTFTSTCRMGEAGLVTSRGTANGDFGSSYKVDVVTTTSGAAAPEMNGTRRFSMEAEWKGPCPAGMKPGDMTVNGMKMNLLSLQRQQKMTKGRLAEDTN